jgi:transketolase
MTRRTLSTPVGERAEALSEHFPRWQKIGDLFDQCIDLMLNLRQSGHPGGSRSKVPLLVATTLGGVMRWDVRHPEKPFGDRFVLVAGHCCPVIYAMLAVYNEALRIRHQRTKDARYLVPKASERALTWEDLLWLRHNRHLPGHAEMEGKTLFFKFNTGPSGHGMPPAVGEALALKHAGAGEVKVFALEGEGGHTAGAHHESKNSAWGLGLDNLIVLFDWNDHGIDVNPNSSVVHGEPRTWY